MSQPKVLNHRASKTAEQLYFLFQNAYRQEAKVIGGAALSYFAPLQRNAATIRLAPSRIIGIESSQGDIVAAIELIEPSAVQPWCLIDGLCVDPSAQRQGHASSLLKAVVSSYRRRKIPLRVKTAVANQPALALYSRFQFIAIGHSAAHGIELMELELPA
ncbi:GNAT family N-acetyltransferase [Simiduia curdlanivorans]|uniref:GNAT family N-acetyltransferase n=1 Tax=Simiduia curdlanivorans TaxID=1492769 RepID=A0ABV8V5N4_9GAMM|nr:GNAT family N-acetyltransferase [Simiduia curdlanivorans]MDN3640612.1 GNAT family N-acetyltransferase [Simiduia curdlanivorans]